MVKCKAFHCLNMKQLSRGFLVVIALGIYLDSTESLALPASTSNMCGGVFSIINAPKKEGLFRKFKFFISSKITRADSEKIQDVDRRTAVRLSPKQRKQTNSILEDLKNVQKIINRVNGSLLRASPVPEKFFVIFEEKLEIQDATVTPVEMSLANKEKFSHEETVATIVHEYFHIFLDWKTIKYVPSLKSVIDQELSKTTSLRSSRRIPLLNASISPLNNQIEMADRVISQLEAFKIGGSSVFTKSAIKKGITPYLKEIGDEFLFNEFLKSGKQDIFGNIEIPFEKIDDVLKLVSAFRDNRLIKKQRLVEIKDGLNTAIPEKPAAPEIYSFYYVGIHELFADLGAILFTEDPSVLAKELGSVRRDFNRDLTFQQYAQEYYALKTYDPHTVFSYLRAVLWREYFAKAPKTQWPLMIETLGESFAKEIAHNPHNIYVDVLGRTFVDFELANLHLESVIRAALQNFSSP